MIAIASRAILLALTMLVLAGCGRREALVVYVSADEGIARPILEAFERKTGIAVEPVFDTEATKTTGLAQRLRSERDRPRADLFWSSEVAFPTTLAEEGILVPLEGGSLDAWPEAHRDPQRRFYAFAGRARVIVVASRRVPPEERPTTWAELANERWRGRIAMADPRFGTTRTHLGAMKVVWDRRAMPGFYESWLDGLADNGVAVLTSGNAGVVQAVVDGSADLGMTDSDDVIAFRRQGAEVDWVFPRHFADPRERNGGTLLIPNAVGLVAGSTRLEAARALVEFLLSPEVEAMLRDSPSGNWPLGPDVAPPGHLDDPSRPLVVDAPLPVDWTAASRAAEGAVEAAIERVGAPGERQRGGSGRP